VLHLHGSFAVFRRLEMNHIAGVNQKHIGNYCDPKARDKQIGVNPIGISAGLKVLRILCHWRTEIKATMAPNRMNDMPTKKDTLLRA
jgi:hypothetical protein